LVDRGSRNHTYLNGVCVESGKPHILELGAIVAFGHLAESWQLVDASEPVVSVVESGTQAQLLGTDGVIGVPSDEDPQCTVYRGADGFWKLERADFATINIDDGYAWETVEKRWRFCCPRVVRPTVTSEQRAQPPVSTLWFAVSRDQEFVELTVEYPNRTVNLGSRAHNYLLLILAKARNEDRLAELPDTTCGWVYKDELAESLHVTPQQVDGEVFRIRKHFAQHGLEESGTIIERRLRTKQLRLGSPRIRITEL
jgi:hypothetical protein